MLSPVYLSSVTFVRPTQPVEIFGKVLRHFAYELSIGIKIGDLE